MRTAVLSPSSSKSAGTHAPVPRVGGLRRLAAQLEELLDDLRRVKTESTLLCALEQARPLGRAERSRAAELREETRRLYLELRRLRAEYVELPR